MVQLTQELCHYSYTVKFTKIVDYGIDLNAILSGEQAPPPQGARFDVYFEGPVEGKLKGTLQGCDYLYIRADGRLELNIRGEITTEDGKKIALHATGVGMPKPGSPIAQLRENATLFTCAEEYAWVNGHQFWAPGTVDLVQGEVKIKGYTV